MNLFFTLIIIAYTGVTGFLVTIHVEKSEVEIITAIKDNGCASHQEIKPTVARIDSYKFNNL